MRTKLRRAGRCVALAVLAASPAQAQSSEGLPPQKIAALEAALSGTMSRLGIPGLSASVVTDHQLRWSNAYGLSDLENFVPAKADTVYRLGSISKPMTATAAMQLFEKGSLDLDAPVQKYLPSFPQKAWTVTPRQILGHLGGIRHYAEGEFESTRHYDNVIEGLEIFKDDPLVHEPGTKYLYSTYGYNLLGAVVEAVSGMGFVEYLRDNVLHPSRMEHTGPDDLFAIIPNRAQGYFRGASGALQNSGLTDTSGKVPGGGLVATAPDVARFAIALQTGLLVRQDTLAQMLTSQKTRAGKATGYGLGFVVGEWKGRKEAYHRGGQQRVSTLLYMQPERRVTIVLLTNLEDIGSDLVDLARALSDIATRR